MGDLDRQIFSTRLEGRPEDDLIWMKELIEAELKKRKFDYLKDREFRVCDKCGFTWPETVMYCRCNSNIIMRREKMLVIGLK